MIKTLYTFSLRRSRTIFLKVHLLISTYFNTQVYGNYRLQVFKFIVSAQHRLFKLARLGYFSSIKNYNFYNPLPISNKKRHILVYLYKDKQLLTLRTEP